MNQLSMLNLNEEGVIAQMVRRAYLVKPEWKITSAFRMMSWSSMAPKLSHKSGPQNREVHSNTFIPLFQFMRWNKATPAWS